MTNKLKYFIGNWKMFGDFKDFKIINDINQFGYKSKKLYKNSKIVMCVPNTLIYHFNKKLLSKFLSLGAQNCHYSIQYGPFTGSINSSMLKKAGAKYIILGHSENRLEGESNELIKKKIISSHKQNLNVIFCIGETINEKRSNKTFTVLRKQIKESIKKVKKLNKIIIAYEPVWSIGTNKIPKIEELATTIKFIKSEFKILLKAQKNPIVLYGGSVNNKNVSLFSSISLLDGFLIGGASQSSKNFIDIVKNYYK